MAEVIDFQKIYSKLGEMQSELDGLFLKAVENSDFRSSSVIIRFNIMLERKVESSDILSEEYRNSSVSKKFVDLGRSLIKSGPVEMSSLVVRFFWSDAFNLMGSAVLNPISASNLANIYIQSVIRIRYSGTVREMFSNSDRESGSPIPGSIRVVLQIEPDGRVSQVDLLDENIRGSLIDKNIQRMVRNWSFPGIKSSVKVGVSLVRPGSGRGGMGSSFSSQIWLPNIGWISFQDWMNLLQGQSSSLYPWASVLSPTLPLPPPREFPLFYSTPSIPIPPPYSYWMSSSFPGLPSQVYSWWHSGYFGEDPISMGGQWGIGPIWDPCMGNPCIIDPVPPSMRLPYLPISEVRGNIQGASVDRSLRDPYLRQVMPPYVLDYGVLDYGVVEYGVSFPD